MKLRAYIPALYSIKIQERISNNYTVRLHHIIVLVIILPNFAQSSDLLPTRAPLLLILLSLFSPSPGILTSSPSHFLPLVQFQFSPYPTLRVTQRRSQLPLWLLFFAAGSLVLFLPTTVAGCPSLSASPDLLFPMTLLVATLAGAQEL